MKAFNRQLFRDTFHNRILEERNKASRHLGIKVFADQIGVSPSTITNITYKDYPSAETLAKVCIWLGVSADMFINKYYKPNEL